MNIPITPIKTERTNGFFNNLGNEASLRLLRRFIKSAGFTSGDDAKLLASYTVESLGISDSWKKAVEAVKRFFSDTKVLATQKSRIEMVAAELHCPRATGVKATLSVVRETEEAGDFKVEILGIGGGDEFTTTFSVGDKLETVDGNCIAAIYSVLAVFELCEIETPDRQRRRFVRLKELEPDSWGIGGMPLAGTADACQTTDFGALTNVTPKPFDFRTTPKSVFTRTLSLASGSKWKSSSKIKLDQFGIDVGSSFKGTRTHKTELEYTLVGGYNYLAVKPDNEISWLWQVTQ